MCVRPQVDVSLQTKQYLADTRAALGKMVRMIHISDGSLQSLAVISDTAWAWGAIQRFTPILHDRIRRDPFSVLQLRCLFLKLKTVLELPLLRISQIGSPDIYAVGEFYSQELVGYVRSVVEVIPVSMFAILTRIIAVQTERLRELPTRLEKGALREYAQLPERAQLAEATHQVAVLTQGILAMERTFMGVIEVDPAQLLEDGIRKQARAFSAWSSCLSLATALSRAAAGRGARGRRGGRGARGRTLQAPLAASPAPGLTLARHGAARRAGRRWCGTWRRRSTASCSSRCERRGTLGRRRCGARRRRSSTRGWRRWRR